MRPRFCLNKEMFWDVNSILEFCYDVTKGILGMPQGILTVEGSRGR
jgi:hypothetical protein